MKRFFGIALVSVMATAAHAGNLTLDARFDYESLTKNDNSTSTAYSAFQVNRLKMDYQGALAGTKFRTKLNLLSVANNDTRSGTSTLIDYAYASREVSNGWSINMGKVILGMGGAEALNNAGDIYLRSVAGDEVAGKYWQGGAQAEGKVGNGKLVISLSNNTEDVTTDSGNFSQTGMMTGLAYIGSGDLTPVISYHTEKFKQGTGTESTNTYMAVGLKWASSMWDVEADYLSNTYKNTPTAASNEGTTSIPVLVRYKMGGTSSVHFKYEMSTLKTATETKINGMTLAYESNDAKADGWNWHVAYTQKDTKQTATATDNKLYFGMRVLADFLK